MSNQGLHDIAEGAGRVEAWLERYGHRAPEEFDLGAPRWRESPALVAKMAEHMKGAMAPLARHLIRSAKLPPRMALAARASPAGGCSAAAGAGMATGPGARAASPTGCGSA